MCAYKKKRVSRIDIFTLLLVRFHANCTGIYIYIHVTIIRMPIILIFMRIQYTSWYILQKSPNGKNEGVTTGEKKIFYAIFG